MSSSGEHVYYDPEEGLAYYETEELPFHEAPLASEAQIEAALRRRRPPVPLPRTSLLAARRRERPSAIPRPIVHPVRPSRLAAMSPAERLMLERLEEARAEAGLAPYEPSGRYHQMVERIRRSAARRSRSRSPRRRSYYYRKSRSPSKRRRGSPCRNAKGRFIKCR